MHGLRFASMDVLAIMKTKALATREHYQHRKTMTDLTDIDACLMPMVQRGKT